MIRSLRRLLLSCVVLCSLTHCLSYDFSGRITQQGNLLPASKISRLKLGMSRQDVVLLMGDSLLHDPFNPNKLDYAYTWQQANHKPVRKYLTLTFSHDRLTHIEHRP